MRHLTRTTCALSVLAVALACAGSAQAVAQGQHGEAAKTKPGAQQVAQKKAAPAKTEDKTAQRGNQANDASPATPPPVPNTPQRTTASFGDWTLRCEKPNETTRLCEIFTTVVMTNQQGQSTTIAQVAIGRVAKTEPFRLTFVLPVSVSFSVNPRVAADDKSKPIAEFTWRRCMPTGCFADTIADEPTISQIRARPETAMIQFRDAAERDLNLPFSTRGMIQAIDALAKEGV